MVRSMRQEDRLGLILQHLNQHGSVGVAELAAQLDVSEASVRRDLHLLETQKLLTRTHGGAVASGVLYELPMRYRGGQQYEAKRAIATAVAALLPADVGSIGLNGGTTTTEVARAIASRAGLRVVTNALNIASELAVRSNIELVVCGGSARSESYELVGPLAELTLSNINLDIAVLGVDGVSLTAGFTTHHEVEAHTNRAMLRAAERVIVVADSTKVGRRGFAKIAEIAAVSDIVTDSGVGAHDAQELRRLGPRVHIVDLAPSAEAPSAEAPSAEAPSADVPSAGVRPAPAGLSTRASLADVGRR
jgi:DeoR family transcriptional regulator of aga operon